MLEFCILKTKLIKVKMKRKTPETTSDLKESPKKIAENKQKESKNNYDLGIYYLTKEKNYEKAVEFFMLATEQGYAKAQYKLASLKQEMGEHYYRLAKFYKGIKNEEGSERLMGLAAKQNYAPAQFCMGCIYSKKYKSIGKAVEFFTLAAEQGHAEAQYKLASLYSRGKHVTADQQEAARWLELSASQKYAPALRLLGTFYSCGNIVEKDHKKSYELEQLARAYES